jgi:hypothetical protein
MKLGKVFEAAIDSSGGAARARRGMVPKKKCRDQVVPVFLIDFPMVNLLVHLLGCF